MICKPNPKEKSILFGVTSSQSLKLLGKIPSGMAQIGWDVHVVSGDNYPKTTEDLEAARLHTLPMVRNPSLIRDVFSFVRWIMLLRNIKPTVVVIGTPKAALLGIVASFLCRVPFRIYQLRGLRLETVSGPTRHILHLFEWVTARSSTKVLAVSPSLKHEYCRLGLSPESKVEVVGDGSSHGVDTNYFHPTRWSAWQPPEAQLSRAIESKIPILGFVGRFSRDKGVRELLKCCQLLVEAGTEHTLLLVGPLEGESDTVESIRLLNPFTVVTGPVKDVAPYYPIMDLLLLPTHREGFPNVILEAAASGVPAITTNATGALDAVRDGETGVIVPVQDGNSLAEAVVRLLGQPELLLEFGDCARERAVAHFEITLVTKKYVDYLSRLVGTSSQFPNLS